MMTPLEQDLIDHKKDRTVAKAAIEEAPRFARRRRLPEKAPELESTIMETSNMKARLKQYCANHMKDRPAAKAAIEEATATREEDKAALMLIEEASSVQA